MHPTVAEQDFTGKVLQTGTVVITKPVQVPDAHMRNGLMEKFHRRDHELDVQRMLRTLELIGNTQQLPAEPPPALSGITQFIAAPCSYGDKCKMGVIQDHSVDVRRHCTRR